MVAGLLLAAAAGCVKPDPAEIVRPLETTLGAAVPAAYFAAVSMAALDGSRLAVRAGHHPRRLRGAPSASTSASARAARRCLAPTSSGTVVVTGTWTPQGATFLMDFTGVSYGGRPMVVVGHRDR